MDKTPTGSPIKSSDLDCDIVSTAEVQRWMSAIETHLSEVCTIASEGKLNSEQKLKISNLCRKISHGSSQMAVLYQSLKQKACLLSNSMADLKDKRDLAEHFSELKQTIQESSTEGKSFADMLKKGTSNFIQPANLSAVAIYPTDKLKTSEETKILVQKMIRPEQIKLQIRGVRKTKNGGVIISTETKNDAEKIKKAVAASVSDLLTDEPYKRKPRIVVIGVPCAMSEKEVYTCIFEQNVAEKCPSMSLDSFLNSLRLSHKSGKKNAPTCNYIIEVPANIRKALISQSRLFINWTACPVKDFTLVTRCYKCHLYGHAAKSCREATPMCVHCGESGHLISDCTKKACPPKCATCSRFKKPNDHKTGYVECPAKKAAEQRYINSVDYECRV